MNHGKVHDSNVVAAGSIVEDIDLVRGAAKRLVIDHFALAYRDDPQAYSHRFRAYNISFDGMSMLVIGIQLIFASAQAGEW